MEEATERRGVKTEAEGGKETSTSKPPFSYVAMIGERSEANKGLFLKSENFFFQQQHEVFLTLSVRGPRSEQDKD